MRTRSTVMPCVGEERVGTMPERGRGGCLVRRRGPRCRRAGCSHRWRSARTRSRAAATAVTVAYGASGAAVDPPTAPLGIRPSFLMSMCTSSPGRVISIRRIGSAGHPVEMVEPVQSDDAPSTRCTVEACIPTMPAMRAGPSLRLRRKMHDPPFPRRLRLRGESDAAGSSDPRARRRPRPDSGATTHRRDPGRSPSTPRHARPANRPRSADTTTVDQQE